MFGRKQEEERPTGGRFARDPAATRGEAQSTTMTATERERAQEAHADGEADGQTAVAPAGATATTAAAGTVGHEQMRAVRARQRDEFGGFSWGSAFFGWLVAFGVAALLSGLLAALGAATGLTETSVTGEETIGLAGGIALLVATAIAYYCGGYVAGRLARFDGPRNGFGVWVLGLLVTIALGALAYFAGSEYNLLDRANLPRLTVGEETATTAGIIAMGAILLVTLLSAIAGGKAGERFHNRIDRHVTDGR